MKVKRISLMSVELICSIFMFCSMVSHRVSMHYQQVSQVPQPMLLKSISPLDLSRKKDDSTIRLISKVEQVQPLLIQTQPLLPLHLYSHSDMEFQKSSCMYSAKTKQSMAKRIFCFPKQQVQFTVSFLMHSITRIQLNHLLILNASRTKP